MTSIVLVALLGSAELFNLCTLRHGAIMTTLDVRVCHNNCTIIINDV